MSQGDDKIMEALATSGAELQPKEGWQDEVRRAIRRQAPQPVRKRSWVVPVFWGGLVTAMPLMLVLFLKNQSDNRADAKAAEQAQASAASDAKKEMRSLAASSAALKVESEENGRALEAALKAIKLALRTQLMDDEIRAALEAVASSDPAAARATAKTTLKEYAAKSRELAGQRAIAETALELLKLKRRAEA
ncbi:MAG: hypothetical protein JKY56_25860, partial [Kofleriaceae bacterium]|nr:hypothetical protein [Kofleriaceae bacterium]